MLFSGLIGVGYLCERFQQYVTHSLPNMLGFVQGLLFRKTALLVEENDVILYPQNQMKFDVDFLFFP